MLDKAHKQIGELCGTVYVPSKGRADKIKIFKRLTEQEKKLITLVVIPSEVDAYKHHGVKILPRPSDTMSIGETREWIMQRNKEKRFTAIIDDDMAVRKKFGKKYKQGNWFTEALIKVLQVLIKDKDDFGQNYGMVGIPYAHKAWTYDKVVHSPAVMCSYLVIRNNAYFSQKSRFSDSGLLEDMRVILGMVTAGIPTALRTDFDLTTVTGAEGGCTDERNTETHNRAVMAFHALYPNYTKLREVESVVWAKAGMPNRLECSIQIKKAYKDARNRIGAGREK